MQKTTLRRPMVVFLLAAVMLLTLVFPSGMVLAADKTYGTIYEVKSDTPVYELVSNKAQVKSTLKKNSYVTLIKTQKLSLLGMQGEVGLTENNTYVPMKNLTVSKHAPVEKYVYKTNKSDVPLRLSPDADDAIKKKLKKGEIVKIEYQFYNDKGNLWGKIKDSDHYVYMPNLTEVNYDVAKALKFAGDNYSTTKSLCAGFVSESINAGMPFTRQGVVANLNSELKKAGFESYKLTIGKDKSGKKEIKTTSGGNNSKAKVGDVVIFYCNTKKSYVHAALITAVDKDGTIKITHSNVGDKYKRNWASFVNYIDAHGHSGSNITFYLLHWPSE